MKTTFGLSCLLFQDEDPSPFFEPFLRTFVLGAGAGVICEAVHSLDKVRCCTFLPAFSRVPALVIPISLHIGQSLTPSCRSQYPQLYGLVLEVGFQRVVEVLPSVMDRFSPAFVADHIAAV